MKKMISYLFNFVRSLYFVLIYSCLSSLSASEVQYNVVHYTVENGLSSNIIYDIYQDKKGYIWFCTVNGLDRFDGIEFRNYKYIPGDTSSLTNGIVYTVFEDHLDNFWVGTSNGLNLYDRYTDTFRHIYSDADDSSDLGSNKICVFLEDHNKNMWFGTNDDGLYRLDSATMTFKDRYLQGVQIHELLEHKVTGDIWMHTSDGIYKYDSNINQVIRPEFSDKFNENNGYTILTNFLLINERVYAGIRNRDNDSYLVDLTLPGKMLRINQYIKTLCYDQDKDILWAGGSTFFQHQIRHGQYNKKVQLFNKGKPFKPEASIVKLIKDNAGSLWIGTNGDGVLYLSELGSQFRQHFLINSQYSDQDNGLPGVYATDIVTDREGQIWYSSWQGFYHLSEDRKSATCYMQKQDTSHYIDMLFKNSKGELWLASRNDGGLYRFHEQSMDFEHFVHSDSNKRSISSNSIGALYEDRSGRFWIGHKVDGLDLFDDSNGKFMNFRHEPGRFNSLTSNKIYAIAQADSGKLWIGTHNAGLNLFDPETNTALHFRYNENSQNCLSDDIIESLVALDDSILWIGTGNGGLNKFNTKTGEFKVFLEKDGLPSNSVVNIVADLNGDIWIATEDGHGLAKVDKENDKIQVYDYKDGLINMQFTESSSYLSAEGELFWGHQGGFISVLPDSLKENTFIPPVVFTDFKISNQAVKLDTAIGEKKHIVLTHEQKVISLQFAALNYFAPERNKYKYILEGFDKNWINAGTRNFVSYTNLPAGDYTFRVLGSNNDDLWNETGASIHITILPPWWRASWAYMAYGLLIFVILYSIRRYELNRQKLKLESEKFREVDQIKSRFFANISHEFRTPLTLIKGPVQQMLSGEFRGNIKKQYQMIVRNTNRLLQLINQLLDLSQLDAGHMILRAAAQDIIPLLKGLTQSFESLARQKNIELKFLSNSREIEVYIDRDKFEKIIINLLSNAFKFTPEGGIVEVAVITGRNSNKLQPAATAADSVEITISNSGSYIPADQLENIFDRFYSGQDGNGYQKDSQGTGIGLALTKELTELHHGTIFVTSHPENGTSFTVQLPHGNKHLRQEEMITETVEDTYDKDIDSIIEKINTTNDLSEKTIPAIGDFPKLLIVEDNADMRAFMLNCLEDKYKINQAEDGAKGFELAVKQVPDIIISDVMMPGMDGFQFCSKIKTEPHTSHIPVILLTAKASVDSKIEGLKTGADDYLTKPFDKRELLVRLKNLIEQRRKLQEKFRKDIIAQPGEITATSIDEQLLQRAVNAVENNISNPDFDTKALAKEVGISRMLLHTKIKALTGQTTGEFIRTLRLKRAAQLLQQSAGNVSEIAYDVGFQNLSYFAKTFRTQFGKTPSQFVAD